MSDSLARLKDALSDRYAIERELGAGGMATVYLAEDLKHHRKVAIAEELCGWWERDSGSGFPGLPPGVSMAIGRGQRVNCRLAI